MTITSNPDFGSIAKADFTIDIIGKIIKFNHVVSGLAIAKVGADPTLTFSIANGIAFISGTFLNIATEANQTVPINQTNKIYLQLSKSGTSPDGGVIGKTTGALPADAIQLAEIITNGTTITTVTDKRDIIDPLVIGYASSLSDFNATKFNGQLRYDTVGKKWQFWDGVAWKSLGGGGMHTKLKFALFNRVLDPTDRIGFSDGPKRIILLDDFSSPAIVADETSGGAVLTFADSQEYRGIQPITFGSKGVSKIAIALNIAARGTWSGGTTHDIKINATNTKIEILDGATVKATFTLPNDEKTNTNAGINKSLTAYIIAVIDLADFVFTDFRIKIYIESTVSTVTDLTGHRHGFCSIHANEDDTALSISEASVVDVLLAS